ncbi:UNVERIFIED_CONTAM: Dynein assembly factor 1, axonemal [Siphonaria sp. JEL0065]|nr:Dynein assembly factor 1, axonemal [Siphonaria sp. JEL0065]
MSSFLMFLNPAIFSFSSFTTIETPESCLETIADLTDDAVRRISDDAGLEDHATREFGFDVAAEDVRGVGASTMLARPPRRFFGRDARETDEKGNTKMTPKYLKQLCLEQQAYATPYLNDKIYLHFKGFSDIENLEPYTGLRSLWLEGNGLSQIKNLDALVELRCLFLHQNCIQVIENLDSLINLDTLNVANNLIKQISGLSNLHNLKTLQIDHNYLKTKGDLLGLLDCPSLGILDLSHNQIEDPEIIEIFEKMPELTVLNIMSNPVIPKIPNYRRSMVSRLKKLSYLDDRPIFEKERLATEAWALGGLEAEREERIRQREEERKEHDRNFEALKKLQEEARAKRIETYGPDVEPEFADPRLRAFRDEQLAKIESPSADDDENREVDEKTEREKHDYAETRFEMSKLERLTSGERDLLQEIDEEEEETGESVKTESVQRGFSAKITEVDDEEGDEVPALEKAVEQKQEAKKRVSFADLSVEHVEPPRQLIEELDEDEDEGVDEKSVLETVGDAPKAVLVSSDSVVTLADPTDVEETVLEEASAVDKPKKLSVHAWGSD